MTPEIHEPTTKRRMPVTLWLVLGIGAGVAIGVALNNLLLGVVIGVGIMLAIGTGVAQLKRDIEDQKERRDGHG